ncbi:MAG: hypothetical protein IJ436_00700 [Bacteroidaceae bacterium]|nr:hypothetical protein [Bacteroidaceae bacterium]
MKKNTIFAKAISLLNSLSWVALLCAAVGKVLFPDISAWVFVVSAVLQAATQFLLRVRGGDYVIKRLVVQQQIGALVLVAAGVLMFTHTRNEWIVAMFIGALLQLYTAFRIPREVEKQGLDN